MSTKICNETKESLVADIKSRLEDGIIEKSNADLIIKLINNAEDLNEAISIASLGTTYRRTGFHFDKRLEKLSNKIKYFKRNDELSFKCNDGKPTNTLIIGDNYDALQNLLIQYRGKIDVIYIDPPYGKDSMGEFAKTNYDNAITRDNLLSMLYNRLVLARELLKEDGVIFCSIDDRNQAYVKCLFDEVFGEYNFIEDFIWVKNSGGSLSDMTLTRHEYILFYSKNKKETIESSMMFMAKKSDFDQVNELVLKARSEGKTIQESETILKKYYKENKHLKGISNYNCIDNDWKIYRLLPITADNGNYYDVLHPITKKPVATPPKGWSWSKETMDERINAGRVVFGKDETFGISQKKYLYEAEYEHKRSTINSDQSEGNSMLKKYLEKKEYLTILNL